MSLKADLHTHTTASDGMQSPSVNVRLAKEAGLAAVAVTDHDTLAGLPEALAAGREQGILVVPGVEISTSAEGRDIHVLGYGISPDDGKLLERLVGQRGVRNDRNEIILAKLAELGVPVTMREVEAAAGKSPRAGGSIGRPHIAQVMLDKGYVSDIREAFDRYLADGKAAYVAPPRITPAEAIRWIGEAGGYAIVAHPGLYGKDELVASLLDDEGADGLEAYHSDHDAEAEAKYAEMAASRNKIATGGSDFHGVRDGIAFHGLIGSKTVDAAIAIRLAAGKR